MSEFDVTPREANYWWRKNTQAGALLNSLMFLFILVPIMLVTQRFYALSFVIFALMVPYGFLLRWLAVRAVCNHIETHPEAMAELENDGVISC